jgi:chromosome segregation ATPase
VPPPSASGADLLALADRVERLAARLDSIDIEVRASAVAVDEKSLRELRRTVEALSKRDPKFEERMTNKVDVIADRLQTLAKIVSTTGASQAARDGEIAALRKELDGANTRVDKAIAELQRSIDPSKIDELRRAIAALAEQKLPRKLDSRIDGLTGKVEVTSQRVDTLAATVATAANSLAGREGDVAALRKKFEEETSRVEGIVAELRKTIDPRSVPELREVVRALSEKAVSLERGTERDLAQVSGKIDALSNRFDALADWASTTGTYLAGRDEEITAFRTNLQDADARLESAVGELHQAVGALTSQVEALDDVASGEAARALEGGIAAVGASVEELGHRLASLETSVATTAERSAGKEAELAELGRSIEHARAQTDAVIGDLRASLETIANAGPDPVLVERLDALAQQVDALAAAAETTPAGPDPVLVERLDALAQQVDALAAQVEAAAAAETTAAGPDPVLVERLDALAQQVDALAAAAETTPAGPDPVFVERLEAMAQQLEELAGRVETGPASEELLNGLARRVESLERDIEDTVDKAITRVRAAWELDRDSLVGEMDTVAGTLRAELASLENREPDSLVEELTRRIDVVEHERETIATEIAGRNEEISSVRAAIDALVTRISSNEEDLAAVAEAPLIVARLDDLAQRLETLEREKSVPAVAPEPVLGDGRFRVEIRALELRIDHAEETARESREAVLVQLERLASRIDMRLDRLESTKNPTYESSEITAGGAQVVPIRSNDV